jgi:hypothetical protein
MIGRVEAMSGSEGASPARSPRELLDPEMREVIEGYVLPPADDEGLRMVRNTQLANASMGSIWWWRSPRHH